jgi:hypothetical protein
MSLPRRARRSSGSGLALVERALDEDDISVMASRIREILLDSAAVLALAGLACGAGWVAYAAGHG